MLYLFNNVHIKKLIIRGNKFISLYFLLRKNQIRINELILYNCPKLENDINVFCCA